MTKENSRYNNGRRRQAGDAVAAAAGETGNRPPQAPEVEAAVIGAMMIDDECVFKAIEGLKEKCFYDPKLRLVFAAIATLFRERTAVDLVTVTERLRTDGNLTTVGGPSRLAELTQQVSSAANIDFYIKILQQKTIQRDLIEAGYGILRNAFDETCEVDRLIEESQSSVFQAVQGNISGGYVEISDAVNRSMQRIQTQQNAQGLTGVPSGFPTTRGTHKGCCSVPRESSRRRRRPACARFRRARYARSRRACRMPSSDAAALLRISGRRLSCQPFGFAA